MESITSKLYVISYRYTKLYTLMPLIKQASIQGKLNIESVTSVPDIMTENLGYHTISKPNVTIISWSNPDDPTFDDDQINEEYSARAMYQLYKKFEPVREFIDKFTTQAVKAAKYGKTFCSVNIPTRIDREDLIFYLNNVLVDDKFEIRNGQLVLDWRQECDFI